MIYLISILNNAKKRSSRRRKLFRERAPEIKIMVGGAVLTEEYAKVIGADFYGEDAMSAVRYAEATVR